MSGRRPPWRRQPRRRDGLVDGRLAFGYDAGVSEPGDPVTSQRSKTADLTFAPFTEAELPRLDEIDRSEVIEALYRVERGALVKDDEHVDVPRWLPGDGDHSVGRMRVFTAEHLAAGAEGIMALSRDKLRGIALVGFRLSPETAQLALLHVSREARRTGVARSLCRRCYDLARARGARQIYVSATPSDSAVGFYEAEGFRLTTPDPALFALEPEDIHMLRPLAS
jgi:ribosomal protein S18 acetylase RimI-like enzyme